MRRRCLPHGDDAMRRRSDLLVPCALLLLGAPPRAQDPATVQPDPAVAAAIEALDEAWRDRRMSRDGDALQRLRELAARLDEPIHPKDRSAVLAAFQRVLLSGRLRGPTAAEPYVAAVEGLGKLGADGARALIQLYERKRFPRHTDWGPMRERILEQLGATGAGSAIPFLLERVQRSGEAGELRAAGASLGRFDAAPQQQRKAMVELLAQRLAGFEALAAEPAVNQDQQLNLDRENAIRTLRAIEGPFKLALHQLTGESLETGAAWQRWFQQNKRGDWPDRPSAGKGG